MLEEISPSFFTVGGGEHQPRDLQRQPPPGNAKGTDGSRERRKPAAQHDAIHWSRHVAQVEFDARAESRARVDGDGWVRRLRWRREPKDTADAVGLSSRRMSDIRVGCKQTRVLAHDASKPPLLVLLFPTSDSRLPTPECLPSAGSEVGSRFHHSSIWIKVQLQHFSRHAQGS
jgi:hypothetical protein